MIEEFIIIKGFPLYRVSNFGNVESFYPGCKSKRKDRPAHWKRLSGAIVHGGYTAIMLRVNNKSYRRLVHRLVLEAFVGPRPLGMHCCHNDGDPTNNNLYNLRWDTVQSNIDDKKKHGTYLSGESSSHAKLKITQVFEILRVSIIEKQTTYATAKRFNISQPTVSMIKNGKIWKSVYAEFILKLQQENYNALS